MNKNKPIQAIICGFLIFGLFFIARPVHAQDPVDPTATTAPEPGYTITLDSGAKSGVPGSVVTYALTITYTSGTDPVDFSVSAASVSGWTPGPTVEQTSVTLTPGNFSKITIDVPVPSTATSGQNDKQSVTVSSSIGNQVISLVTSVSGVKVSGKPLISMSSYSITSGKVAAGNNFDLGVILQNNGTDRAYNVTITFDGGTGFYPQGTGGVRSTSGIDAGGTFTATQTFLGAAELGWTSVGTIKATVVYSDASGTSYSDAFTISLGVLNVYTGGGATATPTASNHAQIVVTTYKTDVELLQPGTSFDLDLNVQNLGNSNASSVTMVFGGGAGSVSSDSGTPQPGGVSGSSGELTNFAPLNSSNLVYLGDLAKGATKEVTQKLIVNTSTAPGVYTLKISFVYTNNKGLQIVDDQVITLLVYSLPQVEVDFYRDPGVITAQMDNVLPIQVTNLGKKTSVLGNMKVTAKGATLTNNISLVGSLDPGGYYTLDVNYNPEEAGPQDITVIINYTDDFNQPREIDQTISVQVDPAVVITPDATGADGQGMDQPVMDQPETFWQKIGRFFKGLFGLDSGKKQDGSDIATETAPVNVYPSNGAKG
jgi:hypothetical protein